MGSTPPDRRAIGAALGASALRAAVRLLPRSSSRSTTSSGLDSSSAAAIEYAARRLRDGVRIACFLIARSSRRLGAGSARTGASPSPRTPPCARLEVGPRLGIEALHHLLRDRLGANLPSGPPLRRIHETSGGNPFFALELAQRSMSSQSRSSPARPLPVPETLEVLVCERAARAAAGVDPRARSRSLCGVGIGVAGTSSSAQGSARTALEPAFAAQVLERDEGIVRFTHPLLATVLYRGLGDERLEVHARSRGSWTSRSSERATSRSRGRPRTPALRVRSTPHGRWRPAAARPRSRPSSPNTRSG